MEVLGPVGQVFRVTQGWDNASPECVSPESVSPFPSPFSVPFSHFDDKSIYSDYTDRGKVQRRSQVLL